MSFWQEIWVLFKQRYFVLLLIYYMIVISVIGWFMRDVFALWFIELTLHGVGVVNSFLETF